jgi:hypothetical protein
MEYFNKNCFAIRLLALIGLLLAIVGCGLDHTTIQVDFQVRASLTSSQGSPLVAQTILIEADKGHDDGHDIKFEHHFEKNVTTGQDGISEAFVFGYKLENYDVVVLTATHQASGGTQTKTIGFNEISRRAAGSKATDWPDTISVVAPL